MIYGDCYRVSTKKIAYQHLKDSKLTRTASRDQQFLSPLCNIQKLAGEVTSEHVVTWAHLALNIPLEINVANELDELKQKKSVILGCFPNVRTKLTLYV